VATFLLYGLAVRGGCACGAFGCVRSLWSLTLSFVGPFEKQQVSPLRACGALVEMTSCHDLVLLQRNVGFCFHQDDVEFV
jgi:hypothetical protein